MEKNKMNPPSKIIIIFMLVVVLLTACGAPEGTPASTPEPSPTVDVFQGIESFASEVNFTQREGFDSAPNESWGLNLATWRNGQVTLTGDGAWGSYLVQLFESQPNYGMTARMQLTKDAVANLALQSGTWNEPNYREYGMLMEGENPQLIVTIGKADHSLHPFNGSIKIIADTWYVVSFFVDADGTFLVTVWQEDDLANHGYVSTQLAEGDRNINWRVAAMTHKGKMLVDSVDLFNFKAVGDPAQAAFNESVTATAPSESVTVAKPTEQVAAIVPTATSLPPTATPVPVSFSEGVRSGQIAELKHFGYGFITDVEYSPDGEWIAQSTHIGINLYHLGTEEGPIFLPTFYLARDIAFFPDGEKVVYGDGPNLVIWNIAKREKAAEFPAHRGYVDAVAVSPNGKFIASSGINDKEIIVWSADDFSLISKNKIAVSALKFTPDSAILYAASNQRMISLICCNWGMSGVISEPLPASGNSTISPTMLGMDVSPDGSLLAIAYDGYGYIGIYEVATGRLKQTIQVNPQIMDTRLLFANRITAVSFSPTGEQVAFTGGYEGYTGIANIVDGSLAQYRQGGAFGLDYSPDGKFIALDAGILASNSLEVVSYISASPYTESESKVFTKHGIFKSGNWNVTLDEEKGTVALFEKGNPTALYTEAAHKPAVTVMFGIRASRAFSDIAIASDESFFVTGGYDGAVMMWQVGTEPKPILLGRLTDGVNSVAISPNGRFVAAGNGIRTILVWDISTDTPQVVHKLEHETLYIGDTSTGILALAFSHDGEILVSGGRSASLKFWQVSDGALLLTVPHNIPIDSIQFSKDGAILYSGGRGIVRWWGVKQ